MEVSAVPEPAQGVLRTLANSLDGLAKGWLSEVQRQHFAYVLSLVSEDSGAVSRFVFSLGKSYAELSVELEELEQRLSRPPRLHILPLPM